MERKSVEGAQSKKGASDGQILGELRNPGLVPGHRPSSHGFSLFLILLLASAALAAIEDPAGLTERMHRALLKGDYATTVELGRSAWRDFEQGASVSQSTSFFTDYALASKALGRYPEAVESLRKLRSLHRAELEKEPSGELRLAMSRPLILLAGLHLELGRRTESEDVLSEVLAVLAPQAGGEADELRATVDGYLGEVRRLDGDLAEAVRLHRRALEYWRGADKPLDAAKSLNNIALILADSGDPEQARESLNLALLLTRGQLKPGHPTVIGLLENSAYVMVKAGEFEKAQERYFKLLSFLEEAVGPEALETARLLDNLANCEAKLGHLRASAEYGQRAWQLYRTQLGAAHPRTARAAQNLAVRCSQMGLHEEANKLHQETLLIFAQLDPNLRLASLQNRSYNALDLGRTEEALALAHQAEAIRLSLTDNVFSYASESQRLSFLQELEPFDLFLDMGAVEEAFAAALHYKGVVLDSLLEDHRISQAATDPEQREQVEELRRVRRHLFRLVTNPRAEKAQLQAAKRRKGELEELLARSVGRLGGFRKAFRVQPEQVRRALPEGTVLVEFVIYRTYSGEARWERRYAALVASAQSETRLVKLGPVEELDKGIRRLQRGIRRRKGLSEAKALYDSVWGPVEKAFPAGTKQVVLCPEGQLGLVPFAVLCSPDGTFVGEQFLLNYVTSGRDLLPEVAVEARSPVVFMGNPSFGESRGQRSWVGISFAPLPFTEQECRSLAELFSGSETLLGEQMNKEALRGLRGPRVLHLATHGFFARGDRDAMTRAGLALTGANESAQSGVLTAAEASTLDLEGTDLVTLSACDTGTGEAEDRIGVRGLRRGFFRAGARNLVTTLWPVRDEETSRFMLDFYSRLKSEPAERALPLVQREWLSRLKASAGPDEAITVAGPFLLHSRGGLARGR